MNLQVAAPSRVQGNVEIEVGAERSIEAEIDPQCVLSVVPYLERRLLPLRLWREGETVSEDSEAA